MAAYYTFEDYSGGQADGPKSDNPYQDVITSCNDNPTLIQKKYDTHRTNRNAQQKAKLLSPDFPGATIDEILAKLENPDANPGFQDPRHCLVFWARPTQRVKDLIVELQQKLLTVVPHLWLMQPQNLHLTALEITHSLTAPEIDQLVSQLLPSAESITNFTLAHRARLVKPLLSFDAQALALSFVPADGEPGCRRDLDAYTYHHLRRDLFDRARAAGVQVASRYVIPSAHLTIGRFITGEDLGGTGERVDLGKVRGFVEVVEGINGWLQEEYWPREGGIKAGGEWVVGEEKGLEFRKGALWYGGGGETVMLGEGF